MASPSDSPTYFRKGFGLKAEVQEDLATYEGDLVDRLRAEDYTLTVGDTTIRLAREFGFCYGVERAVEYAYQTRRKFTDRRIFLVGEIIHNPYVNARLRDMGIEILDRGSKPSFDFSVVRPEDVVILPAFGVTIEDFEHLRELGCILVDTTCGSVLNVWKRVESYARDGFTALIHGKYYHEETRATASQVRKYPEGHYLVVRDMDEARMVCAYIEGQLGGEAVLSRFAPHAVSPGFDPARHLQKIGVANQTTMLARESLAIGEEVGRALVNARGEGAREDFRTFDTICSATQERQDAVLELLREPLDVMVVIGGFNSSNTISLASLCAEHVPTYHIEAVAAIDSVNNRVHYRKPGIKHVEADAEPWLPRSGPLRVGLTAGASTPNNKIGDVVSAILKARSG